jgi:hypothetical protein
MLRCQSVLRYHRTDSGRARDMADKWPMRGKASHDESTAMHIEYQLVVRRFPGRQPFDLEVGDSIRRSLYAHRSGQQIRQRVQSATRLVRIGRLGICQLESCAGYRTHHSRTFTRLCHLIRFHALAAAIMGLLARELYETDADHGSTSHTRFTI